VLRVLCASCLVKYVWENMRCKDKLAPAWKAAQASISLCIWQACRIRTGTLFFNSWKTLPKNVNERCKPCSSNACVAGHPTSVCNEHDSWMHASCTHCNNAGKGSDEPGAMQRLPEVEERIREAYCPSRVDVPPRGR